MPLNSSLLLSRTLRRPILYFIVPGDLPEEAMVNMVCAALRGGVDMIQVREKGMSPSDVARRASALRPHVHAAGSLLVVNDSLEAAQAADADGLHLGPEDLSLAKGRQSWPAPKILGGSARTVERALELEAVGADYLGVGPVFGTTSKPDAPGAIGLARLSEITRSVRIPVFAIGGIDSRNAASAIDAGAAGVALISSIAGAENPQAAARDLRVALDGAVGNHLQS